MYFWIIIVNVFHRRHVFLWLLKVWFWTILVLFKSPRDELCYFNLLDLLCCESVFTHPPANLPHSGSPPLRSQNNFTSPATAKQKGGLSLGAMLNFSPSLRCFPLIYLSRSPHERPEYNLRNRKRKKKKKPTLIRQRPAASESKTNTGPSAHTSRGLLTLLASTVMLTHFMICSFSDWQTASPSAAQKKTPVWVCLIPACGSALGTLLGPF